MEFGDGFVEGGVDGGLCGVVAFAGVGPV